MLGRTPVIQNGCVSSHHIVKPENKVLWKDLLVAADKPHSCTLEIASINYENCRKSYGSLWPLQMTF